MARTIKFTLVINQDSKVNAGSRKKGW